MTFTDSADNVKSGPTLIKIVFILVTKLIL